MQTHKSIRTAAVIFVITAMACHAAPFTNGGFDTGALSPGWTGLDDRPAATVEAGYASLNPPQDGGYCAVYHGQSGELPAIRQTFDTEANAEYPYKVSLYYGRAQSTTRTDLGFVIDVFDGVKTDSTGSGDLFSAETPIPPQSWTLYEFEFFAVSDTTTIRIWEDEDSTSASVDLGIDSVSIVSTVPEPASAFCLMLATGLMLSRRRRQR